MKKDRDNKEKISRRDFTKSLISGLAASTVVAKINSSQLLAQSLKSKKRYAMLIDLKKCVGCESCTIACKQENLTPPNIFYNVVWFKEVGKYPKIKRQVIPRPCMHCEHPACLKACPAEAIYKRDDGIVIIDYEKCIGARQCIEACPYSAITFDEGTNYPQMQTDFALIPSKEFNGKYGLRKAEELPIYRSRKCTFCLHRQDESGNYKKLPACVQTCMSKARIFGDLNDPNSQVSQLLKARKYFTLKPEAKTQPSVYYLI
jgi:molybdopterin-containing oxidoreductase family iron-sulfur binding subunit